MYNFNKIVVQLPEFYRTFLSNTKNNYNVPYVKKQTGQIYIFNVDFDNSPRFINYS